MEKLDLNVWLTHTDAKVQAQRSLSFSLTFGITIELHRLRARPIQNSVYIQCLARDVIYTFRAYATMSLSVCLFVSLSVTFVHCGHRVQWIPDISACLDRWMSLLLTDNASPGSSDGMMPGFLVEEGVWKNCNCSDITYFTY